MVSLARADDRVWTSRGRRSPTSKKEARECIKHAEGRLTAKGKRAGGEVEQSGDRDWPGRGELSSTRSFVRQDVGDRPQAKHDQGEGCLGGVEAVGPVYD